MRGFRPSVIVGPGFSQGEKKNLPCLSLKVQNYTNYVQNQKLLISEVRQT